MPAFCKLVRKFWRNRRCRPKCCPHLKTDSPKKIRPWRGYSEEFPGHVESIYKVLANQEPCSIQLWKVAILAKMVPCVEWVGAMSALLYFWDLIYDKRGEIEYLYSLSCSSSCFPCVGVRLVYWSLRSTATFVISFHRSLLLAFSLHFSSSFAFLKSLFTQSSHLSCGLPRFLEPSCLGSFR